VGGEDEKNSSAKELEKGGKGHQKGNFLCAQGSFLSFLVKKKDQGTKTKKQRRKLTNSGLRRTRGPSKKRTREGHNTGGRLSKI